MWKINRPGRMVRIGVIPGDGGDVAADVGGRHAALQGRLASGGDFHREVIDIPAGAAAGTRVAEGDSRIGDRDAAEAERSHVVAVAAAGTAARTRYAGIGEDGNEGGGVGDIRHVAHFHIRAAVAVAGGPEGDAKLGEVVGELGECQHVDAALHLGGVGAGMGSLTVVTIDERGGAVIDHLGDRRFPTDELLHAAAWVVLEVFRPRVVNRNCDSSAASGERGGRGEHGGVAVTDGGNLHAVEAAGIQTGEGVGGVGGSIAGGHVAVEEENVAVAVAMPGKGGTVSRRVGGGDVGRREAGHAGGGDGEARVHDRTVGMEDKGQGTRGGYYVHGLVCAADLRQLCGSTYTVIDGQVVIADAFGVEGTDNGHHGVRIFRIENEGEIAATAVVPRGAAVVVEHHAAGGQGVASRNSEDVLARRSLNRTEGSGGLASAVGGHVEVVSGGRGQVVNREGIGAG